MSLDRGNTTSKLFYRIKPDETDFVPDVIGLSFEKWLTSVRHNRTTSSITYSHPGENCPHTAQYYTWNKKGHPYGVLVISLDLGTCVDSLYDSDAGNGGPTVFKKLVKSLEENIRKSKILITR